MPGAEPPVEPSAEPCVGVEGVVALADGLRAAGIRIGTGQVEACHLAVRALRSRAAAPTTPGSGPRPDQLDRSTTRQLRSTAQLDRATTDQLDRYWAGRLTLVSDPEDIETYDRVFRWLVNVALDDSLTPAPRPAASQEEDGLDRAVDAAPGRTPDVSGAGSELTAGAIASERERLRRRRFDRATDDELAAIGAALQRLQVAVPHRTSRRTRPGRRGELDLARTLEASLRTDGELVDRSWRARRTRPRRLVVLLDVSGSMAGNARALLRFAVAARRTADREASRRVEVFAFGTRLTRLSDELSARDPDAAIAAAASRVVDWDGGTRIGASVDELVRVWARRGVLRGAVVVVCSDGLERGDPALLAAALGRLRRHVHRIVWVNPLAGDARYAPSQRGMAAALPHVDELLAGHDLASLEALSEVLERLR